MLRRDVGEAAAETTTTTTKIRKRCALSSSSSGASDRLRKLRLKRGVVVVLGRRGGGASPCSSRKMSESSWNRHHRRGGGVDRLAADGTRSSVSARKLVSALWQLNKGSLLDEEVEGEGIARDAAARQSSDHRRSASVEFSKRSRTKSKALEADGERSCHNGHGEWCSDMVSNGGKIEVNTRARDSASTCSGDRMAQLQDMYNSLIASKELVGVLSTIWGHGDLNPSTASLLSALRSELDLAHAHARQLVKEQRRHGDEIGVLKKQLVKEQRRHDDEIGLRKKQLVEEARAWKSKQREKAAATVRVVAGELDGERRARRRAERVNAKLAEVLAETECSLQAAARELERERRSRERLEEVCDELVRGAAASAGCGGVAGCRGAGEVVEEMRREAERAQEELEKEREMLRLADELREERVQMKLMEARLQFEEKNAAVEQLRGELEAFLETKKEQRGSLAAADDQLQLVVVPQGDPNGIARAAVSESSGEEDDDDDGDEEGGGGAERRADDPEGSDMHSIELNMDGGNSKDCSWSYTPKNAASFSVSDRGTECAADPWAGAAFDRRSLGESEGDQWDDDDDGRCSDRTRDLDEDAERYWAIKNLREQMLAGHGFVFLSQADGADAEREHHRHGLMCQIEERKP